jgi:hypothetical protein
MVERSSRAGGSTTSGTVTVGDASTRDVGRSAVSSGLAGATGAAGGTATTGAAGATASAPAAGAGVAVLVVTSEGAGCGVATSSSGRLIGVPAVGRAATGLEVFARAFARSFARSAPRFWAFEPASGSSLEDGPCWCWPAASRLPGPAGDEDVEVLVVEAAVKPAVVEVPPVLLPLRAEPEAGVAFPEAGPAFPEAGPAFPEAGPAFPEAGRFAAAGERSGAGDRPGAGEVRADARAGEVLADVRAGGAFAAFEGFDEEACAGRSGGAACAPRAPMLALRLNAARTLASTASVRIPPLAGVPRTVAPPVGVPPATRWRVHPSYRPLQGPG